MSSQGTGAGGTSGGTAVKARSRPTRQAAQQHKYADMKTENGFFGEEETPQSYGTDGGDPNARVDLKKMTVQALRKYTKVYELPNVHPQSSKQELETAVEKHWNMMNVTEDGVVQNLMRLRSKQY